MDTTQLMIPNERISRLKANYQHADKEDALEELREIINIVERVKEEFEIAIDEYNLQQPKNGRPYYGINMPKWSRDQARATLNDLKALERKIISQ
jgi:hypothetical protein